MKYHFKKIEAHRALVSGREKCQKAKRESHQHSLQMELCCNSQIKILTKRVMVCNEWPSFSSTSCALLDKISEELRLNKIDFQFNFYPFKKIQCTFNILN